MSSPLRSPAPGPHPLAKGWVITLHALRRFIERQLYWLPCGVVAVVVAHEGRALVKTILTREQAIADL
jgi:hypothetical protein